MDSGDNLPQNNEIFFIYWKILIEQELKLKTTVRPLSAIFRNKAMQSKLDELSNPLPIKN